MRTMFVSGALVAIVMAGVLFSQLARARGVEQVLDERSFAQAVVERVQKQMPETKVALHEGVADQGIRIEQVWPDGGVNTWFIANAYQDYRNDPAQLDAIVDRHLRTQREARETATKKSAAAAPILPVIKTRAWFDATMAQFASLNIPADQRAAIEPLHRSLAGDLLLTFIEDHPDGMQFVTRANPAAADLGALEKIALDNLAAHLGELKVAGKNGRYRLELDRNYEASMVLLLDRWRSRLTIDGDPVIAIAARDTVMICGSRDHDSIAVLRKFATDISAKSAYGLSSQLWIVRAGKLEIFSP